MGWLIFVTILFIAVSVIMILIILVQRPQGGGLAGAFGGASGGSTDTVFGGRVGDALTTMTVVAFALYLLLAISLNMLSNNPSIIAATQPALPTPPPTTAPMTTQLPPPTTQGGMQTITVPAGGNTSPDSAIQVTPMSPPPGTGAPSTPPLNIAPPSAAPPVAPPPATSPSGGGTQ